MDDWWDDVKDDGEEQESQEFDEDDISICGNCGTAFVVVVDVDEWNDVVAYCPFCGDDM